VPDFVQANWAQRAGDTAEGSPCYAGERGAFHQAGAASLAAMLDFVLIIYQNRFAAGRLMPPSAGRRVAARHEFQGIILNRSPALAATQLPWPRASRR
jgi:hypothetical protein